MDAAHPVERFRWKGLKRRLLGADLPLRDAEGATRAVAEGGWLAVAYPKDRARAFVDAVERAEAVRQFARIRNTGGNRQEEVAIVRRFRIESSVGAFEWRADAHPSIDPVEGEPRTHPLLVTRPGTLVLPDDRRMPTSPGTGFFDVPGLLHAYEPWRDADVAGGWRAITEVSLDSPDEWRPILAALPLLLFTAPPGLFA